MMWNYCFEFFEILGSESGFDLFIILVHMHGNSIRYFLGIRG